MFNRDILERPVERLCFVTVREWALDLFIIVLLPACFLMFAPIQKFPMAGWVDPAIYVGLALDFENVVKLYGWNYHALRVSFVLPYAIAHFFFQAHIAQLVGVFSFYLLGLLGFFVGARVIWGRTAAIFGAVALAYNPVYVLASTSGYVDAAYLSYVLCLFGSLGMWSISERFIWLMAAGAFALLAIIAHILAAAPVGLVILFFALWKWDVFVEKPISVLLGGLSGALVAWMFLVVVFREVEFGPTAFLSLQWIVTASVSGIGEKYRMILGDWLPHTTRLLPGIAIACLLISLVAKQIANKAIEVQANVRSVFEFVRSIDVLTMLFAFLAACMLPVYDVVFGGATTQVAFYAGLALPGVAVGTAGAASILLRGCGRSTATILAVVVSAMLAAVCALAPTLFEFVENSQLPFDLTLFAVVSGAICLAAWVPFHFSTTIAPLVFCSILAVSGLASAVNRDSQHLYLRTGDLDNVEYFEAMIFVASIIDSESLPGRAPYFWFDREEFSTFDGRSKELARPLRYGDVQLDLTFYDNLASLRLWNYALFSPELFAGQEIEITPALASGVTTMVVVEQDGKKLEAAVVALAEAGLCFQVHETVPYEGEQFGFSITLIDVIGKSEETLDDQKGDVVPKDERCVQR